MQVYGVFILPFTLPIQVCCACICQIYLPCVPTYRGMSRNCLACAVALCPYLQRPFTLGSGMLSHPMFQPTWGLVCLFALRPRLHRPVSLGSGMYIRTASLPAEACHVWYAYSPSVPTYKGLSSQGLACFVALCPTYKDLSCWGLVCLFTLQPYLQRTVVPWSGLFIHSACLPTKACCAGV